MDSNNPGQQKQRGSPDPGEPYTAGEPYAGDLAEQKRVDVGGGGGAVGAAARRAPPVDITFRPKEPANPAASKLWESIRLHTEHISFPHFDDFVRRALCAERPGLSAAENAALGQLDPGRRFGRSQLRRRPGCSILSEFGGFIPGVDAYAMLKLAAEIFLLLRCGVCNVQQELDKGDAEGGLDNIFDIGGVADDPRRIDELSRVLTDFVGSDRGSYIRGIVENVFGGTRREGFSASPFCPVSVGFGPCLLELIWSYWHEEGMLVQTTNAIALRFQNVLAKGGRDPLAEFELDPLRALGGFLWGYVQDEPNRLTVARRAYEYQHHYGLSLYGKATSRLKPADTRSRFLQAFHDLLRITDLFYREAADNTVTPDPFPLLIALRDLHLILAEGAHNQFRDLPWTARGEMLVQQWLLAREQTRDFLRGRFMVPYPEEWMGAVDAMKRVQGWSDTNIIHFHDLGVFGERLLLSIRYVAWDKITDPAAAEDWALVWRPEIQGYIHAYRMVTGVSLSDDVVEVSRGGDSRYMQPAFHLRNRLLDQKRSPTLPEGDARARLQLGALPRTSSPES